MTLLRIEPTLGHRTEAGFCFQSAVVASIDAGAAACTTDGLAADCSEGGC
jgi:hypothetical protein